MALVRSWDRYGRRPTRRTHPAAARPRRPDERFNSWLDQKLRRLYEAELSEPIPEDMLRLLKMIESGGG
ncbi:MAG TPA: NepR family anti-sigma factor [Alphaproteobacteria bacterium]